MTQNSNLDQKRQIEIQQIQGLLKRQNDLLGQSLMNLDQILFLQKSISRLNLKDISEVLVEKLPYILSIRYFTLFLYDKNKRLLTLACNNHPGIEDGKEVALKDSGVMQDALTQGRYILEPDFTKSKYFAGKRNPLFKDPFMVCIPLMIENEIIGVMNLNDNDRGYFSVGDLDFVLNVMEFISLSISNALLYQKTELLSVTDGLTLLHNHQHMQKILQSEFARCKRYQSTLSVVMMDVDHFKNINDTYGHQVGDEVLVEMAQVISRFCRANDAAARYGGEEFILILPETALEGARQIAERIRGEIENKTFGSNGNSFKVTLSCGVVEQDPERINSPAKLVQVADRALYRAKEGGRNQTQVGEWMTSISPDTFLDYGPLPTLPSQIERVMDQAARTSAMDYNIVKMIQFDPAIAAQVVQMANAPLYGYPRQISSLQQAAGLLGPGVIKSLILTTPMLERYTGSDATYKARIDYVKLLNHASTTGAVAGGLGNLLVGFESDVCFTAGLVHDIGKIALAVFQPRMFVEVCDYAQSRGVPLSVAEKELMGFTHYEIGATLGRSWGYPDSLMETFQPPAEKDASETNAPFKMIIQLARILAIEWGFDDGTGQSETAERSAILESLHLTEKELVRCGEDIKPGLDWVVNS